MIGIASTFGKPLNLRDLDPTEQDPNNEDQEVLLNQPRPQRKVSDKERAEQQEKIKRMIARNDRLIADFEYDKRKKAMKILERPTVKKDDGESTKFDL